MRAFCERIANSVLVRPPSSAATELGPQPPTVVAAVCARPRPRRWRGGRSVSAFGRAAWPASRRSAAASMAVPDLEIAVQLAAAAWRPSDLRTTDTSTEGQRRYTTWAGGGPLGRARQRSSAKTPPLTFPDPPAVPEWRRCASGFRSPLGLGSTAERRPTRRDPGRSHRRRSGPAPAAQTAALAPSAPRLGLRGCSKSAPTRAPTRAGPRMRP